MASARVDSHAITAITEAAVGRIHSVLKLDARRWRACNVLELTRDIDPDSLTAEHT